MPEQVKDDGKASSKKDASIEEYSDIKEQRESSLEYSRFLYDDVKDWYKNADTKAQILLTLMGVFVTFLTSSIFVKADDLSKITRCMTPIIWIVLVTMVGTVTLAVISGLACLWSLIPLHRYAWKEPEYVELDNGEQSSISGRQVGFFATLITLNKKRFQSHLQQIKPEDEVEIRLVQTYYFSRNVYKKHFFLDIGFVLAFMSLLLFLLAGTLYIKKVSASKGRHNLEVQVGNHLIVHGTSEGMLQASKK
mgnify:CR=1 FL=1